VQRTSKRRVDHDVDAVTGGERADRRERDAGLGEQPGEQQATPPGHGDRVADLRVVERVRLLPRLGRGDALVSP